ncbi:pilin N-terminal domain-containing protein [Enterococcus sp. DIV0800]|uniref:pilin N-terminal domain-containing protein n=1 Tax=unclassified Enterococcus TaxID=2608891 RepID=UPI003D2FC28B
MKKMRVLLLIFPLLLSVLLLPVSGHAQDTNYSITIQKYKLGEGVNLSVDVPQDGTKAEKVTDDNGNDLEAFEGVSYEIVRVSPMEGTSEFQAVQGEDAFSTEITTDAQGIAHVGNLVAGTYRVSEKATELIPNVMEPVIFELPLPQRTGNALSDVYLYPKSSIQTPSTGTDKDKDKDTPTSQMSKKDGKVTTAAKERLPQTSGNLGTMQPLYLLIVLICVMGAIGGYFIQTKKHHF